MRGCVVLCSALSVEAARRGRLLHAQVEVRLFLLARDALHRAVIRHPFVCVVLIWWPNGWLFFMVHVFPGGRGYLKYLDLYLQGSMSGDIGRQVVVLRPCQRDGGRVCVAEVDAGICQARLRWSVRGLASWRSCEVLQAHMLHGQLPRCVLGRLSPRAFVR